ncbi:MAG: hypothetical protein NTZ55_05255 [Candidatus Roizmanbacteria bacterium]|nr:hypothetical protein [Candidatus Roizmanbacteria bacterium]
MQKLKNNIFLSGGLLFCTLLYFVWVLFQNRQILFRPFNAQDAEIKYSQSQWQQSQNISEDKVLDEWAIQNGFTGWKNYKDETPSTTQIELQRKEIIKEIQNKGVSDSFLYSYVGYKYKW